MREHISEIFGAVGTHISSLASPVFGTSAKNVEKIQQKFETNPKTSKRFRTLPNVSEPVRTHPGRSEQVQTRLRTYENFEKLAKTSRKLRKTCENFAKTSRKFRESCVRAVVVYFAKVSCEAGEVPPVLFVDPQDQIPSQLHLTADLK